jgi:hypothetical protein
MRDVTENCLAAADLREKAGRCRRLALEVDAWTRDRLNELADEYEAKARELENSPP